jgi:hypothetical protein
MENILLGLLLAAGQRIKYKDGSCQVHFIEGPVLMFASSLGLFYVVTLSFNVVSEKFLNVRGYFV